MASSFLVNPVTLMYVEDAEMWLFGSTSSHVPSVKFSYAGDAFELVEVGIGIGKGTRLREMRKRKKMAKTLYVCLECNL